MTIDEAKNIAMDSSTSVEEKAEFQKSLVLRPSSEDTLVLNFFKAVKCIIFVVGFLNALSKNQAKKIPVFKLEYELLKYKN